MKKLITILLAVIMATTCLAAFSACNNTDDEYDLIVYGSTEEEHLRVTVEAFMAKTGYKVAYQRLSAGEVQTKISEEVKAGGTPSADVFFGGTNDIYNEMAANGLLYAYKNEENMKRFVSDSFYDKDGYWYGIYKNVLGIFYNTAELELRGLDAPEGWIDLLDPKYAGQNGLITACNPNTAGTGKQFINVISQLCKEESFQQAVAAKTGATVTDRESAFKAYFAALNKNIKEYTKSGGAPANYLSSGNVTIGVSYMQNVVEQVARYGITNAKVVLIKEGTGYEICSCGIFANCKNLDVAKEFIDYCSSVDFVSKFKGAGCYATPVVYDENGNPYDVEEAKAIGVTDIPLIAYDTEDAKTNTSKYVGWFTEAVGSSDSNDKLKTA